MNNSDQDWRLALGRRSVFRLNIDAKMRFSRLNHLMTVLTFRQGPAGANGGLAAVAQGAGIGMYLPFDASATRGPTAGSEAV
jgi:hypothetical protein